MKKLVLLFSVFVVVLTSCSSDDDVSIQDSYIGKWQYSSHIVDGVETPFENCEGKTILVINSDATWVITIFEKDEFDLCQFAAARHGTWVNVGEGLYSRTVNGIQNSTQTFEIKFEENSFYWESDYNGLTIKDVYIRIE